MVVQHEGQGLALIRSPGQTRKKMSYGVPKEHGQEDCCTVLYSPKAGVGNGVGLFRGMVREQEKTRGEGTNGTYELHGRKYFLDTEQ